MLVFPLYYFIAFALEVFGFYYYNLIPSTVVYIYILYIIHLRYPRIISLQGLIIITAILLFILYMVLFSEPLMCCDEYQEKLKLLQKELEYWQNDLVENQARYHETNLDKINDNLLDQKSKDIKQHYINAILEGGNNVTSSIRDIANLKSEYNEWFNSEIIIEKRPLDDTTSSSSNKR